MLAFLYGFFWVGYAYYTICFSDLRTNLRAAKIHAKIYPANARYSTTACTCTCRKQPAWLFVPPGYCRYPSSSRRTSRTSPILWVFVSGGIVLGFGLRILVHQSVLEFLIQLHTNFKFNYRISKTNHTPSLHP